jgi:hypothetical protein
VCAIDATGVGTFQLTGAWLEFKHGKKEKKVKCKNEKIEKEKKKSIHNWVKLHGLIDTSTNLFLSADVTIGTTGDSPHLEPLVQSTAKDFKIAAIMFKSNNTGNKRGSMIWSKCFQFYKKHPKKYLQIYHRRSKIEAVFGSYKKRFGDTVLTKTLQGQKTEVMLKVLLHNLACLTRLYYEENLEIQFSTQAPKASIQLN